MILGLKMLMKSHFLLFVLDIIRESYFWSGTWQTFVVKEQNVWHKIDKTTPIEYAASITVNPLTALRMLEDFVDLKSGNIK